ncbi:LuxR C-terminal-related transcriptional regulator [Vibrio fluvialis]|nr:LuxR C-terminal-related transcriptional regulator [Vibrio fluvialis]MBY7775636.1 LuxR C-terminal-related transcriptional regulator [Vibrio fluvialis]MBY7779960.1 LuxR C-terminal-related transcriptional regulator [Vibrio fluvialis]MBY7989222.1 LuxR C-terminal-related transcriptional regulator [Vibrio fluvialis]MBY7993566.1 LuxR C-terminal-related transcriptional regulator [Vibrio fluvialis]
MNYPGIQNALLFSEESLTSTMLKETLGRNLPLSVELQRFSQLSIEKSTCAKYIFIDFAHITDEFENNYYNIKYQIGLHAKEILINCPRDISVAYLFKWPNLYGVFYADDYIDKILQGTHKIMQGEMWLSRQLSQDYILHFLSNIPVLSSRMLGAVLTKREHEVVKLLVKGKTNPEIAEHFGVSLNTVKSHLHNLFKKINAKNRVQAVIWAKDSLGLDTKPNDIKAE